MSHNSDLNLRDTDDDDHRYTLVSTHTTSEGRLGLPALQLRDVAACSATRAEVAPSSRRWSLPHRLEWMRPRS